MNRKVKIEIELTDEMIMSAITHMLCCENKKINITEIKKMFQNYLSDENLIFHIVCPKMDYLSILGQNSETYGIDYNKAHKIFDRITKKP